MEVIRKNPLMTRRCAIADCEEVIYRDTLDKDEAWAIEEEERTLYFHSEACANLYENRERRECQMPHCAAEAMDEANICEQCWTRGAWTVRESA